MSRLKSPECIHCGERRLEAMLRSDVCYECALGRSYEKHHLSGLQCGPSVLIPANDHRVLSVQQDRWPKHLRSRKRNYIDEASATILGLVNLNDLKEGPPFLRIHIPPSGVVRVQLSDVPGFVHVLGSDKAWYRPNQLSPWQPCPLSLKGDAL